MNRSSHEVRAKCDAAVRDLPPALQGRPAEGKKLAEFEPAPGIVLVAPDAERTVGAITVAEGGHATVATGRVSAVGPPRGDDPDLREMGLDKGMTIHYTRNGARELGNSGLVAVDHACILAWQD
jgi:hypothetical protein